MKRVRNVTKYFKAAAASAALLSSTSILAQETATPAAPTTTTSAEDTAKCELHVWPTENYIGIQMGLLSGFGIVGAVADMEAENSFNAQNARLARSAFVISYTAKQTFP